MTVLGQIIANKRREVNHSFAHFREVDTHKTEEDIRVPLDFREALRGRELSIISEVKKASPSKGLIRADFDPTAIALSYQQAGTDCISVLTEKRYFQGDPDFLCAIRSQVQCPLLRKDFIIDKRQIRESYRLGADAILLIVSALSIDDLKEFSGIAKGFGLSCLVEVHDIKELEVALELGFDLIGVNNRNLTTFKTDLSHSIALKKHIPSSVVTVSESGIKTANDCLRLGECGFNAVLVGETLMRQPDPGAALIALMSKVR